MIALAHLLPLYAQIRCPGAVVRVNGALLDEVEIKLLGLAAAAAAAARAAASKQCLASSLASFRSQWPNIITHETIELEESIVTIE